jgi:thiamine pyrophosphate-dependent acetolactate synthase large subunit-like protein
MLGTDFPYTQFYPEKATIVQVDQRGEHLNRRTRLDLGAVKATLSVLLPLLTEQQEDAHLQKFVQHYREVRKDLNELAVGHRGRNPMHPQYVAKIMDELAAVTRSFRAMWARLRSGSPGILQ